MQEYHSFKVELAMMDLGDGKTVGVDNAIFLQDIAYWCDYNKSSGVNSFDGRHWMYSTVDELCQRHPYWTPKQMRRIISSCEKAGLLLTGNFCKNPYDRTKWYAVSDAVAEVISGKSICQNGQIEVPKWANGEDQTGKCNRKYKNKIQKEDDREEEKESGPAAKLRDEGLARVMSLYLERIEPMPSRTSVELLKGYVEALGPAVCERAIERAIDAGARKWTYIHAVLKNCEKDGIRSLADWDARESEQLAGRSKFKPPGVEEVAAYVRERGSRVDPQWFIDYYAAKGWMIGKAQMTDWKAACRSAEKWDMWNKPAQPGGRNKPVDRPEPSGNNFLQHGRNGLLRIKREEDGG